MKKKIQFVQIIAIAGASLSVMNKKQVMKPDMKSHLSQHYGGQNQFDQ